jgi:hypothetical protein
MNSDDNRTKLVISLLLGVVIVCIVVERSSFFVPEAAVEIALVSSDAGVNNAPEYPYPNHSDEELAAMSRDDVVARNELLRRRIAERTRLLGCCPNDAADGGVVHLLRVEYH